MVTAADVVAEARDWKDTPFIWQASLKGVGADCKGLILGVARELGLPEAASLYAAISDYGVVPVDLLHKGLAETFERVSEPRPGDILCMVMRRKAQHLGIHAGKYVIHTYGLGPRRVILSPIVSALAAWPLHSAWRFRSLEG